MNYFKSDTVEIMRSEIHPSDYNPRKISEEARRQLKRSIKQFGVVGGLVVNKTTMTLVSGHQKLSILDELNKSDYPIKVEMIEVDEKTEKELNIFFNNPNAMGTWDYDLLRELIPDIDYTMTGLTKEDLNLIGCDFLLQTEGENDLAKEIEGMTSELNEKKAIDKEAKKAHMKEVKEQVKNSVQNKSDAMNAYVTISFDSYESKADFMERFGFEPSEKFIKGEVFDEMIERID